MTQLTEENLREMHINSAKNNAQDIYDDISVLFGSNQHKLEEILEMTGLIAGRRPASEAFKLVPVTDDLSDQGVQDLCYLMMEIKEDMLAQKNCPKKIAKLRSYASPNAYMDYVA